MDKVERVYGSDKRLYGNVFANIVLFYTGLCCLDALWYFIYYGHWWPTYLIGLLGFFFIQLVWVDLFDGCFYSRDFLCPIDEKKIYVNGIFMVYKQQGYMLKKKFWPWEPDTEAMRKLPVKVFYNAFGKAVDRRINITELGQIMRVR